MEPNSRPFIFGAATPDATGPASRSPSIPGGGRAAVVLAAVALFLTVPQTGQAAKKSGAPKAAKAASAPQTGGTSGAVDASQTSQEVQIDVDSKFLNLTPEGLKKIPGSAVGGESGGAVLGVFSEGQWAKLLEAVGQGNGADLLSSPRVTVRSGQKAMIEVVRTFRYPTNWAKNAKKGSWEPKSFADQPLGIRLGVLATHGQDGTLEMALEPEFNAFEGWIDQDDKTRVMAPKADSGRPNLDQILNADTQLPADALGKRLQPIFSRRKVSVQMKLLGGETVLMLLAANEPGESPVLVAVTPRVLKPKTEVAPLAVTADSIAFDAEKGVVTAEGNVEVETAQAILRSNRLELKARKPVSATVAENAPKSGEKPADIPAGTAFKLAGAAAEKISVILAGPVNWKGKPLGEVLAILHQMSVDRDPAQTEPESRGVHFVLELPDGAPEPAVTLELENPTLLELVEEVARVAGLRVTAEPAGFHFGAPRSAAP
ncbi:MAG: hypothetical protein RLZZ253_701 [Verrucomicrobiota bacterium]